MTEFRTKLSVEEVFGAKQKPDSKEMSKKMFWLFIVPLSAFLGFMTSVFIKSNVFIPVTLISVVVLFGIFDREKSN
jgi:hypothetical protein